MAASVDFAFTVDDIGYDGYSTESHLNNILDFCDGLNIKATLFAVPIVNGKKLNKRDGYISILRDAVSRGHEVAQHGLEHDRFEVGIPPEMILNLPHEEQNKKYLEANRISIEKNLSVDNIRWVLKEGRDILEDAIGVRVKGFRAPALQTCDNLFTALEYENYLYDSSVFMQKTAWDILNGDVNRIPVEITCGKFSGAQKSSRMVEFPLTAEYTWYLTSEMYSDFFELIKHDSTSCSSEGIPFVPICHVSPIQEGEDNSGFQLYRELLAFLNSSEIKINSLTCSGLVEKYRK